MSFCKYCGHELPSDARFCPACGKQLSEVTFTIEGDNEEQPQTTEPKKKRSWSIPFILLLIAIAAAGVLTIFNQFSDHSNALIPKDIVDEDSVAYDFDDKSDSPIDDAEDALATLRRRVQNIYSDVLKMNPSANYTGRYCTTSFNTQVLAAARADRMWIDFDYWIFGQEYDRPALEQMKVKEFDDGDEATVQVALRPIYGGRTIKIITLKLEYEDGVWLIDDFQCDGISIKTRARRAIEESQIRSEILESLKDSLDD